MNGVKVNEAFDSFPHLRPPAIANRTGPNASAAGWELWPLGKGPKPAPAENE